MSVQGNQEVTLQLDPARILVGLSRIGYTPPSALCDIVDNAVTAGASTVRIKIVKDREDLSDSRRNNVKSYVVIDDGSGMDETKVKAALTLGSPNNNYAPGSLSKFGLGLKSAAFSQGDELVVISSPGGGAEFVRYSVSLPAIQERGQYFAAKQTLTDNDYELIEAYLPNGRGTIIRIDRVRKLDHPSVKNTVDELRNRLGVIYFYFIRESGLDIYIDDEKIAPFDVLFVEEAEQNGNLNEHEWDGKTVRWIEKPHSVTLDGEAQVKAIVEVTQLPHPPLFELDGGTAARNEIRNRYQIAAGNYGYYVYRNKRLISWAEGFRTANGSIVPQSDELYAFRGRILIDDSADDIFNIDVKKATITLSDEAWSTINDLSDQYKRKSRRAWVRASKLRSQRIGLDPNHSANAIVENYEPPEFLPGDTVLDEETVRIQNERRKTLERQMREHLRKTAGVTQAGETDEVGADKELDEDELQQALTGGNPHAAKIFRVDHIEDNALWEPYYDTDRGHCVRINRLHRFAQRIFEDNAENPDLQIMIELLLLQLAAAELYANTNIHSQSADVLTSILSEYRRITSEFLADMVRKLGDRLPPVEEQS